MKHIWLVVVWLVCSVQCLHAHDLEKRERLLQEQPRTVLKESQTALKEAMEKNQSPRLIEALMQMSAAQLLIDADSITSVAATVEHTMNRCQNKADRSVIALYLASLYRNYAYDNTYRIRNYSYIKDNPDIMSWNLQNFQDKIMALYMLALSPADVLQQTPIAQYNSIIVPMGGNGDTIDWEIMERFYPTMYDFVVSSILTERTLEVGLGNIMPFDYTTMLQAVTDFHKRQGNRSSQFIWRLRQLRYDYTVTLDETLLIASLDSLIDCYQNEEYVIEAVTLWSEWVQVMSCEDADEKQRFYNTLKAWVARYPLYYRTDCLREICAGISMTEVNVQVDNILHPDDVLSLKLSYRNVDSVQYRLFRCKENRPIVNFYDKSLNIGDMVATNSIRLRDKPDFEATDTIISISKLPAGVYKLYLEAGNLQQDSALIVVTPYMLLTMEVATAQTIAFVVDSKSGAPVKGVLLNLLDEKGVPIQQYKTNSDGICNILSDKASTARWITFADIAQYPMKQRIDFERKVTSNANRMAQLFTDRNLYRPGQELHFSALVYRMDSEVREVLPHCKVAVKLLDFARQTVWSDTLETDRFGSIHNTIQLPENAANGRWLLQLDYEDIYTSQSIEVSEYKRPQFAVSLDDAKGSFTYGDTVCVQGNATTFSGVGVAGAQVNYTVSRRLWYYRYSSPEILTKATTTTNKEGDFELHFVTSQPVDPIALNWGTQYIVEATVTAATGESQYTSTVVSVQGHSLSFDINAPEIIEREQATPISLYIKNGEGVNVEQPYEISIYALHSNTIGESLSDMSKESTPLWHMQCSANVNKLTPPFATMPSGGYRLIATTRDSKGKQFTDSVHFILYSQLDEQPPTPTPLWAPQLRLAVNNGEKAHFVVGSTYENASLLTIVSDNNRLIEIRRYELHNSNTHIEVPYKKTYGDMVQIKLILVREKEIYRKNLSIERRQPDMNLYITPSTFRDKTVPGSCEKWQFTVRDANGKPVDALFMTEMYDASLDQLRAHKWHFNPRYNPQHFSRYRSLNYMWDYCNHQNLSIWYKTEYEQVHCNSTIYPSLFTFLPHSYGLMSGNIKMLTSTHRSIGHKNSITYDNLVVEESAIETETYNTNNKSIDDNKTSAANVISYRENRNETAFFYPHLVTDREGNVVVEFTMPESNTTWNFFSLAITPSLQTGAYNATVVSSKPLMVAPNMPRFVRQGDKITLAVAVQNTTDDALSGCVELTLYLPENNCDIATYSHSFAIDGHTTATHYFDVEIPDTLSLAGVRVGASTPLYSDGEQHLLAVLPATQLVTESHPFYIQPTVNDTTIIFKAMQERMQNRTVASVRTVLEYCDNPAWYAVTALPSLATPLNNSATAVVASLYANRVACGIVTQNKIISQVLKQWSKTHSGALRSQLEQNETLKQILLSQTPWVLDAQNSTEQLQELASLLDTQRAMSLAHEAVKTLADMQSSDGGWAWFKEMQPSFWTTMNILAILSQLPQWGESEQDETIKTMELAALRYLDNEYVARHKTRDKSIDYYDLCYLYVRSAYLDVPLSGNTLALHQQQLDSLSSQWYRSDLIEKAYTAITMFRYGKQSVAEEIVNSLRQYATTTPSQGIFWANNRSNSYYNNSAIQAHCAIYEAFELVSPRTTELNAMRQWLLLQKQTQAWGNVPSTIDAVKILLTSGSNWLNEGINTHINWGNKPLPNPHEKEVTLGYEKYMRNASEVDASDATLTLTQHSQHPSWGAIYWQYYDSIAHIQEQGNSEISLTREYYVEREGQLAPIATTALHQGDIVTVRIQFYTHRDMQYITLTDNRPACFEPVQQLPEYQSGGDIWYYQVPADASTQFYIDYLPRGTHIIEYQVYADRKGTYHAGIATLQSYYAPQYTAHTTSSEIIVE